MLGFTRLAARQRDLHLAARQRDLHGAFSVRRLASAAASQLDPHAVLGLSIGASEREIKLRYYELAKQTHPDAMGGDGSAASFLAVQDAFSQLMNKATTRGAEAKRGATTGTRRAAGPAAGAKVYQAKPPTLGEVLCARLASEPEAAAIVWEDIKSGRYEVTTKMSDMLFKACATHLPGTGGMRNALAILRDGTALGMFPPSVRATAIVSLLTWCKEQEELDATFEVVDEIRDEDRTPEVLAALSSTFSYFPSGASF